MKNARRKLVNLALVATAGLVALACASTPKDPTMARAAIYDADANVVFEEMTLAIKKHYPNLVADSNVRLVKTAWHALPLSDAQVTGENPVWGAQTVGKDDTAAYGEFRRSATSEPTRYFIRFDVRLVDAGAPGGSASRVEVSAEASVFDPRGMPTKLTGAERPYWLDTRIGNLEVAIFERLRNKTIAAR